MRLALAAGLLLLWTAAAAPAAPRDDRTATALKVVHVDARAAMTDAKAALADAKSGKTTALHNDLARLGQAVGAVRGALTEVTPPPELAAAEPRFHGLPQALGSELSEHLRLTVAALDRVARHDPVPPIFVSDATWFLHAATRMLRFEPSGPSDCSRLTHLRGPVLVNGLEVTKPQLTVQVSCTVKIDGIDVEIPNVTWGSVDAGGDQTSLLQGGKVLQVAGNGSKSITFSTEDTTGMSAGASIDIIEIAGDGSGEYFGDVM